MNPMPAAEHLHVMANHAPLMGLAFAIVPLLFALMARQRAALWVGLIMILISGASLPVVMQSGERAFERFVEGQVPGTLDAGGQVWMAEHEERAERVALLLYTTTATALAGMVLLWKRPNLERVIAAILLALCAASVAALMWVAAAGGRIRHPEFRPPDAPAALENGTGAGWNRGVIA